ncbi:arabinogalactan endo-beta-1,4-galactanase [Gracilimonas sp. Q87]|uniref:glycoside hydrolase family 53 protein n=1 Tax=Gracilimonas sp. Q87 TaxID=3384766 RepID=UPI003983E5E9
MKLTSLLSLFIVILVSQTAYAQPTDSTSFHLNYAVGADLSFLKMAEENGTEFKDNGVVKPGLDIFSDHGYDWIRLRLFHSPDRLPNDLEYTIELAQEAQKRGMKFLLDYHYSDSWADPQKQWMPEAWEGLEYEGLRDSVYDYTKRTIEAFREAGVMPEMVQIGNEIRNGMIWPAGQLPENWDTFAGLLQAGIDGVDAGRGQEMRPQIMIHYDNGADAKGNREFYDNIEKYGIEFDIIGLSYYPWWHGNLLELRENLLSLMRHYDEDIILVETAYNWRPSEYIEEGALAPWPETPEGQKDFLETVHETLININSSRIKGIFWWEPAVTGGLRSRGYFDDDGNALPVINVFDKYKRQ